MKFWTYRVESQKVDFHVSGSSDFDFAILLLKSSALLLFKVIV